MDRATHRHKRALFVFFFVPGAGLASWVTRTPEIRDTIGASLAQMGLVLFGLSVGSMTGILMASRLISWLGLRRSSLIGLAFVALSLFTVALSAFLGSMVLTAVGLALFGLGMGIAEIAVNLSGANLERKLDKPILHILHGCFSLGTLCGAIIGLALEAAKGPVDLHLLAIAVVAVLALRVYGKHIPEDQPPVPSPASTVGTQSVWRDPLILMIGFTGFVMALAEGAANDWLPIIMVDEHGLSKSSGSLIFAAFAAAMSVGRLGGGFFISRFGSVAVMRVCIVMGASGVAYIALGTNPWMAGVAVILWGLGVSLGFPVALSAAGLTGNNSASRVKAVAIVGYIALLGGPPSLGFLGESYGLRAALLVVFCLLVLATICAPALKTAASRE